MSNATTNEVAKPRKYDDVQLREVKSFDDALNLARSTDGDIANVGDILGTGFDVLNDKSRLIGVAFVILDWTINKGDMGEFVSVALVTEQGDKFVINDGSTGIFKQLHGLGAPRALGVRKGLRVSRYNVLVEDRDGNPRPKDVETFYLDTAR